MWDPQSARNACNTVMQLMMGYDKSSVVVPIAAAWLANDYQLVRAIVAKAQSKQMAQMTISKLCYMLNRRVYYMPFSRALRPSKTDAYAIGSMLRESISNGGILLVQPEHILSFKLMVLVSFILGEVAIGRSLSMIQDFFDNSSRDLVDESDENFSVNFELIYTIERQKPVDMAPDRWLYIHEVLSLVKKFSQATAHILPGSLESTHCLPGKFPRTRILKDDAQEHLFRAIALYVCNTGLDDFPIARQSQTVRDAVFVYITKPDSTAAEMEQVENAGPG